MSKHIEMITDYIVVGEDYQYNDNHGILTRCKDCNWYDAESVHTVRCRCKDKHGIDRGLVTCDPNDYCSYAVRKGN